MPTYNVAIVGAGPAGLTAAEVLERAGLHVIVIEAGGPNTNPELRSANFFAARSVADSWRPQVQVRHTAEQPWMPYRQGRGIGGGGAVNGMVCLTNEPSDFMTLTRTAEPGALGHAVMRAWGEPLVDLRQHDTHGVGLAPLWLGEDGQRRPFPMPAEVIHAPVTHVSAGDLAVVHFDHGEIVARRVLLCAGAIETARLVAPLVGAEMVGTRIQDHPGIRLSVRLRPEARITDPSRAVGTVLARWDDLQLLVLDSVGVGATESEHGVLMIALMAPDSRGHLRFGNSGEALLELNMLSNPYDCARLRVGLRRVIELVRHGAFASVIEDIFIDSNGTKLEDADYLYTDDQRTDEWMLQTAGDYSHVVGSCPAGIVTGTGADLGQVRGALNVWIGDASLFARVPISNTMIPTMIQAKIVAQNMLRAGSLPATPGYRALG
jgi:choline dehydrogenase-like flavoprotein